MKYKVGDKVRINSIDWYNENKNPDYGFVYLGNGICFYSHMSTYCGKTMTISEIVGCCYRMAKCAYDDWTDEMIEGLVEEENNDCEKCGLVRNSVKCLFMDNCPHNKQKNIIEIPEGYILKDDNGNVINATRIVLEKKKSKYPKTYDDCVIYDREGSSYNRSIKLSKLEKLLICRDAYWKIAGEEMGLGKPWEPDYSGTFEHGSPIKYVIYNAGTHILKGRKSCPNHILAFPTSEMRDAFYENFKKEIEICKELL